MGANAAKTVTRLEDLLVEEVSIVDRPANKRRFLTVKSEAGMGAKGTEIHLDASGNLVTGEAPPPGAPAPEPVDLAFAFAEAGEVLAAVEKRLALPSDFRTEIFRNLYDGMRRMSAVLQATEIARADDDGKTPLVPLLMGELEEIRNNLGGLLKKLGKVTKGEKEDDPAEDVDKAVWTTAQVNEFPDSSFLYVKPGGKKDESGKTVPRSNRMFPVRDAAGKLDLPHVRNAIARAPQANLPDDVKARIQTQARRLLAEAQKERFAGKGPEKAKKDAGGDAEGFEAQLVALVESVEKRGAKMSKDRLARFKEALGVLGKILQELDIAQAAGPKGRAAPTQKGADPVTKAVESLAGTVEKLAGVVQKQGKDLRALREARPGSNVIPVEKGNAGPQVEEVSWPLDMNDPKTRQTVDKATSFIDS